MRVNAVVVAAGQGVRMGTAIPKAFLLLGGRPLILHTLNRFSHTQTVRKIIVVAAATEMVRCRDVVHSDPQLSKMAFVFQTGGRRRQDSVYRGLLCLDADCEIVVIHDAARPFISPDMIDRCVEFASREGGVIVGVPVRDTIKVVAADGRIQETPSRVSLWEAQTPQVFQTEIIRNAYELAKRESIEATDDSTLVERLGKKVILLEGSRSNLKITVPEDLLMAEILLRKGNFA